jgi:very-short-patch-repair endonuclease
MTTQAKPKGKARKAPAHFTPEFQGWARRHVSSTACAINGSKGFIATLKKHGPDVAFNGARRWRLDHPSSNELRMIGILSRLRIAYEREYGLGDSHYTVDFYLPETPQAIEVDSRIHDQFDAEKRRLRAVRKRMLLAERGIDLLTIWDKELARDAGAVIRKIQRFVDLQKITGKSPAARRQAVRSRRGLICSRDSKRRRP